MPPRSPEENYLNTNETVDGNKQETERFVDIERGDVSNAPQQDQNQNITQPVVQPASQPQQQVAPDPVQILQNMISAGFTPTKAQISSASAYLGGPVDSSNTWFAIFLQRLLKQRKSKTEKKY